MRNVDMHISCARSTFLRAIKTKESKIEHILRDFDITHRVRARLQYTNLMYEESKFLV